METNAKHGAGRSDGHRRRSHQAGGIELNLKSWISAINQVARRYLWFPALVFFIHELGAHVFNLYGVFPPFDIPMHLLGGFAIAYFISGGLIASRDEGVIVLADQLVHWTLVFALATTVAVFWEYAEWLLDHTIGTTAQLSQNDTMLDLLCGMMGAAAFIGVALVGSIRKRQTAN